MGGSGSLLAAHVLYILVIAAWVGAIMTPFFLLLKRAGLMRVPLGAWALAEVREPGLPLAGAVPIDSSCAAGQPLLVLMFQVHGATRAPHGLALPATALAVSFTRLPLAVSLTRLPLRALIAWCTLP
jgi:hypothetical protein